MMAGDLDIGSLSPIIEAKLLKKQPTAEEILLRKKLNAIDFPEQLPQRSTTAWKQCICAPTSHPGSFRCRHHRSSWGLKVLGHQSSEADSKDIRNPNLRFSKKSLSSDGEIGTGPVKLTRFAPRALPGGDAGLFL